MFTWVTRFFRILINAIAAEDSPKQLAWGVALGVVLGLVPKGNLTAIVLLTLMFSLRVNLAVGLSTAGVCSLLGSLLDPISHVVGTIVLTWPGPQGVYAFLLELPFARWTALNNTVVLGSLLIGLFQLYPTYLWSRSQFAKRKDSWQEFLRQYRYMPEASNSPVVTNGRVG